MLKARHKIGDRMHVYQGPGRGVTGTLVEIEEAVDPAGPYLVYGLRVESGQRWYFVASDCRRLRKGQAA